MCALPPVLPSFSSTMDLVEPPPQSPSIFLDLPPTPYDGSGGVPASVQQQEEDVALEHISRMLMGEEEDRDGRFSCHEDHPALLHIQQSLAQIISSSSSSDNATTNSDIWYAAIEAAGGADHSCISSTDLLTMAFLRGREEASKLLPRDDRLVISPEPDTLCATNGLRVRLPETEDAETGRASKKLMAMAAPAEEMIARMMASDCELPREEMEDLRAAMADEAATRDARRRRRKQQQVDMRTLLVHCAQAVDDRRGARELLRQVKQHASPTGDATQRLAHCFAEALEARLAGAATGRSSLMATNRAEFLKAYRLFMATCCFEKVAFMFANLTICRAAAGRSRLHVVDYGLHLGFQWPDLLRWLAARDGGPPEVTITFIDHPQPGFRPARRIEETGRSLSNYARDIGVPFKFRAIAAARWDTIGVEELGLGLGVDDPGAVLVVNSLFKLETLVDDSVVVDSPNPRDRVLGGIRGMRPAVFTHGVVNGFYGNSFLTRFREALFYYSAVFDLLDATMPRGSEQRRVLERDVLGPCALNVIACEGRDRTDRFDSYKQWQLRSRRAGLRQLPLDREIVGEVRDEVRKHNYHRDFVIDEDHGWLLQGWKGRILYAHSNWVADDDYHNL
ncbi:hypothetical protein GQ55_8G261500 [Panicum hallii var. hallii]|uniref:Uncharacterized protein n=1 Tax=Panicum hallii var. hallii TaxID=1504633 RepID=A0A2T7CRF7_9POAL|nr:hypothetical protein GQ55_8G261500 [Panicum hallii var. hallii]